MSKRVAPSLGCGYIFVAILALGGGGALVLAGSQFRDVGRAFPAGVWVPALIGLLLLAAALTSLRFARRLVREHAEDERRRADHPDEPWLWHREWLGERIESEDPKSLVPSWLFACVWNGISAPAVVHFILEPPRDKLAYLVFLFPLVGLGLLATAIHTTLRLRKYGRVRFAPASLPGVIGGHLGGVIEVPARVDASSDLLLELRCIRKRITGSGKNRRVIETVLWKHEERVPPEKVSCGVGHTAIPVLIAIPRGQPATDLDERDNQVLWRLSVKAETPGVDFTSCFHLPVFVVRGLETAPDEADTQELAPLDPDALRAAGIERQTDGWSFNARPLRTAKVVSTMMVLGLGGLTGLLMAKGAFFMAWAIPAFFGLIALLFAYDLWHAHYKLRVVGEEVEVLDSSAFRRRRTSVARSAITAIRSTGSISIGESRYHRLFLVGGPVGDPSAPAHAREPFATRRLRHRLARAEAAESPALRAQLAASPRFEICCAGHIPGTVLEGLRAELLAELRNSRICHPGLKTSHRRRARFSPRYG